MRMLIEKMRHDARIDVWNDWKLVTILTGGNEMCSYCEDRVGGPKCSQNRLEHFGPFILFMGDLKSRSVICL